MRGRRWAAYCAALAAGLLLHGCAGPTLPELPGTPPPTVVPELPPQLVDRLRATAAELDVLLPTLDTCTDVDPMACPHAVREAERLAARLRSEVNPGPYTWSGRENMRRAMDSLDRDVAAASTACLPEPADADGCRNAVFGIAFHVRGITYLLERLPA